MIELRKREPLTDDECRAVMLAARRLAKALERAFAPLGILTFQNNGVYSGQETPHFHFHVVPRTPGSDWGIGPPQLASFEAAGRVRGTTHDASGDAARRERVRVTPARMAEVAVLVEGLRAARVLYVDAGAGAHCGEHPVGAARSATLQPACCDTLPHRGTCRLPGPVVVLD